MVKVSEITNIQLQKQIQKYKKILDQLVKEREKRRARGEPGKELYTPQEIAEIRGASSAPKQQAKPQPKPVEKVPAKDKSESTQDDYSAPELSMADVQLEIDVDEIERLKTEEESAKAQTGEEEEEVRVTQLLQLSKDQIAELKKAKK